MIRPKERVLVLLILGTFGFVSFATIWYLPEKSSNAGGAGNKVYNVYKKMDEAGRDLILPPPPHAGGGHAADDVNEEGGVMEAPDVYQRKVEDKARLLARVELDKEIEEMHRYYILNSLLSKYYILCRAEYK